jgi:uncharacterized protein with HEPN domain
MIQSAINNILEFTKGMTLETYESDLKTRFAVERNFEIIGEAAARISEDFKMSHPEIEWRILKDFRNFIIHEYFGINNEIIWDTIQIRLPELLISFQNLVK